MKVIYTAQKWHTIGQYFFAKVLNVLTLHFYFDENNLFLNFKYLYESYTN